MENLEYAVKSAERIERMFNISGIEKEILYSKICKMYNVNRDTLNKAYAAKKERKLK